MDAANQQACKCLQPVDGGESVTTAIQKDPRDAISRPKLFIKWAECSPVPWNLKLHCVNTTGHSNVLLTLLFKLHCLYTQETRCWNTSRLCLTLRSALIIMCDGDDQQWWNSSCCRWYICFLNYCMRSGFAVHFPTRSVWCFLAATPPMWLQAWATATRAYQRRARKRLQGEPPGSCSGGGRARGCASPGYDK